MQKPVLKNLRTKVMLVFVILVFPAALTAFALSGSKNYALISFAMVIMAMVPFLMLYEMKKPQAREWIPLAVMAAIAAVGRAAFAALPHFKPVSAIIIITAMTFGPEAGFLTGAVAALASNLFFGQGPWTPWQIIAWGLIGFIAGVLGRHNLLKRKWQLLVFGMLTGYLYGWILNVWTATGFMYELSWKAYIGLCATSFIPDTVHGVSTVVFLWLLADDWGAKLRRIKYKFGILAS